jgi:hypothetical protein
MDFVESKIEFIDKVESFGRIVDESFGRIVNEENILDDTENISITDSDDIVDEFINTSNRSNTHLFFTNILNNQKIQINRNEYNLWLKKNYEDLKNIYYIIYNKYFLLNNVNLTFKDFTEFCYLYY